MVYSIARLRNTQYVSNCNFWYSYIPAFLSICSYRYHKFLDVDSNKVEKTIKGWDIPWHWSVDCIIIIIVVVVVVVVIFINIDTIKIIFIQIKTCFSMYISWYPDIYPNVYIYIYIYTYISAIYCSWFGLVIEFET